MMSKTRQRPLKPDPLAIPDPLALFPDPMRPNPRGGERRSSANVTMPGANIAANGLAQGATAGGDIAMPLALRAPIDNGNANEAASSVDPATTKPNTTLTPAVISCAYCGREFTPRRPSARYCHPYCRRRAWLERNPEKAAELAARDKARLRAHFEGSGREWREDTRREDTPVERCADGA